MLSAHFFSFSLLPGLLKTMKFTFLFQHFAFSLALVPTLPSSFTFIHSFPSPFSPHKHVKMNWIWLLFVCFGLSRTHFWGPRHVTTWMFGMPFAFAMSFLAFFSTLIIDAYHSSNLQFLGRTHYDSRNFPKLSFRILPAWLFITLAEEKRCTARVINSFAAFFSLSCRRNQTAESRFVWDFRSIRGGPR